MISVDQALEKLLENAHPVCAVETIAIEDALSRVLAEPIVSSINVPPADNSSMDGYAVKAADIKTGMLYDVSQRITAGLAPGSHVAGTATQIFTGSEIPDGADAVIMQENSQAISIDSHAQPTDNRVRFTEAVSVGDNIRKQGQDVLLGSEILSPGIRLRPQEIGLIASCGIQQASVYKPLKIVLVATGDELIDPGKDLWPGQIYNSNRYMINALCQQAGFELVDLGTAQDDLDSTKARLETAANEADLVITTGGVSVGEEDHVKAAVEATGSLDLWKVAIKPGKPLAFGKIEDTDFIGLPGNPASVFTTFLILALPRLKRMQGLNPDNCIAFEHRPALFNRGMVSRREYLRARRTQDGLVCFPNQSSAVLASACRGDGFAIQREHTSIKKGQSIEFVPYINLF